MGVRLANNLKGSAYDVAYVEVSDAGQARVKEATGANCVPLEWRSTGREPWCWRCRTPRSARSRRGSGRTRGGTS